VLNRRGFARAAAGSALAVVLFTLALITRVGGAGYGTRAIDDLGTLAAAVLATGAAGFAARRRARSTRLAWTFMTAGMASWAAGELIWACYELGSRGSVPFPSPADIGYLLAVPLVVVSVLCFPSASGLMGRSRAALDGMVLVGSLLVISWASALGAVYRTGGDRVFSQVVGIAYPAGDIVIISVVLTILIHRRQAAKSPLFLVGAGMLCMGVADSAYEWLTATNTYHTGNPIDALWVAAYLLIGLAALRPESDAVEPRQSKRTVTLLQVMVPYFLAAGAFAVIVTKEARTGDIGLFLFCSGTVLAVLVSARQLLTLVDNRALTEELSDKVAELGSRERQLEHLALHDPLTNLANRKLFQDRLEHALAKRIRVPSPLGVLFIDLDDFKTINDSLGHDAGDQLLISVAERLRAVTRTGDTAARLGGDEFGVLIDDESCDIVQAGALAARILEALRARFFLAGREVSVRASIGVVLSEAGQEPWEMLLRNADVAMYAAKANGKGSYEVFAPHMARLASDRLDLREALDEAIDGDQLEVHYQPIVELATGRVLGVEALARWNHPDRGEVAPAVFIPLAEETGRIVELGRMVLERACRDGARWTASAAGVAAVVSVNLSAVQLSDRGLLEDVKRALTKSGLPPSSLTLEITESVLMRDTERTLNRLTALRALGVKLAIDDFGTGYSALSYLPRFPVDVIKIDRAFVKDICDEPLGSTLARTIVELSRRLSLDTIAEGVETRAQAEALHAIGCVGAQGWWFAAAAPLADLPRPGAVVAAPVRRQADAWASEA
jgi:diguanylate cyclase (GGDEF)-like protein